MSYSHNGTSILAGSGISVTPTIGTGSNTITISATNSTNNSFVNVSLVSLDYTATVDDYYIGAIESGIVITLPAGLDGKMYIVKNQVSGNIKVVTSNNELLDTAQSKTLGTNARLITVFDGSRWNLL